MSNASRDRSHAKRWVVLSGTDAAWHPLYGLRGLLLVVLLLTALGLGLGLFEIVPVLPSMIDSIVLLASTTPPLALLLALTIVAVVAYGVVIFLGLVHARSFRAWAIGTSILAVAVHLGFIIELAVLVGELDPKQLLMEFLKIGANGAVLAYYIASRRVRVTYLWQVAQDDPYLLELRAKQRAAA
jgi:hypothetical protein